jgi:hypothetical protein
MSEITRAEVGFIYHSQDRLSTMRVIRIDETRDKVEVIWDEERLASYSNISPEQLHANMMKPNPWILDEVSIARNILTTYD